MIIFGIIGFVLLFWFALVGLWKLIPWLIILVMITTFLGFVIEHLILSLVIGFLAFGFWGMWLNWKDENKK